MYIHMSEAAEVTKDNIKSRNHTDDQGRGYKSKFRQEKSNEGIGTPRALRRVRSSSWALPFCPLKCLKLEELP